MTYSKADAHLHFFKPGYANTLPESCRRLQPDEITLYSALAQKHQIAQVLAVGYEGDAWASGNNAYLAELAAQHAWVRPVAYQSNPGDLSIEALEQLAKQRFVGLSIYLFDDAIEASLSRVEDSVWQWLVEKRWLISVNSRGERWRAWLPVLTRHPELRLLVSHLGLPPAVAQPPSAAEAQQALASVIELARFPGTRVKLSGFYALTTPGYDYPHRAAWPYVEALLEAYGSARLLWASDFSPSLEWLSFAQTIALFDHMPFLDDTKRQQITGENLLQLLTDIDNAAA